MKKATRRTRGKRPKTAPAQNSKQRRSSTVAAAAAAAATAGEKEKGTNVQVVIRCRPQNAREIARKEPVVVTCDPAAAEVTVRHRARNQKDDGLRRMRFDHVFGQYATQAEIYDTVVEPVVREVLQGFSCSVFCYGQTGTGKTYTMEGKVSDEKHRGIIPRAVEHVFAALAQNGAKEYSVKLSGLEIYNEQLEDLLVEAPGTPLKLVKHPRTGVVVQNLASILVNSADEIYQHLAVALEKRRTSATLCNKQSSRSHSVFTLTIHSRETNKDGEELLKVGKLNLVDLAGSECIGRSGARGDRKREAGNINQSLLTLGRVITALVEKHGHVPYRDSKLTRLLQESLGGRAKTTIIATVTPSASGLDETSSTLSYANRAKNIENRPEVNQRMTKRALIREYCVEMDRIKQELMAARAKDGVFLPQERYDELLEESKAASASLREAEEALKRREAELEELMARFQISQTELDSVRAELATTEQKLGESNYLLDAREASFSDLGAQAENAVQVGRRAKAHVGALHLKIQRKASAAEQNRAQGGTFSERVRSFVGNLEQRLADGRLAGASRAEEAVAAVTGLAAERDVLGEQMARLLSALTDHSATGAQECVDLLERQLQRRSSDNDAVRSLAFHGDQAWSGASASATEVMETMAAHAEDSRASGADRAHSFAIDGIHCPLTDMQSWFESTAEERLGEITRDSSAAAARAEAVGNRTRSQFAAMREFIEAQQSHLLRTADQQVAAMHAESRRLGDAEADTAATLAQAMRDQQQQMRDDMHAFTQKMQAEMKELLHKHEQMTESTIERMLEQSNEERQRRGLFAATRATEVARAYGHVAGTLLPDLLAAGADIAAHSQESVQSLRQAAGQRLHNTREFWDKIVSDLATRVASVQDAATAFVNTERSTAQRDAQRHSALLARLDQILTSHGETVRETYAMVQGLTKNATKNDAAGVAHTRDSIANTLERLAWGGSAMHQASVDFGAAHVARCNSLVDSLSSAERESAEHVEKLRQALSSMRASSVAYAQAWVDDVATGETPVKQPYTFPSPRVALEERTVLLHKRSHDGQNSSPMTPGSEASDASAGTHSSLEPGDGSQEEHPMPACPQVPEESAVAEPASENRDPRADVAADSKLKKRKTQRPHTRSRARRASTLQSRS